VFFFISEFKVGRRMTVSTPHFQVPGTDVKDEVLRLREWVLRGRKC
jgi:hypothetical protein